MEARERILLVEDEMAMQVALKDTLESAGYRTIQAMDGEPLGIYGESKQTDVGCAHHGHRIASRDIAAHAPHQRVLHQIVHEHYRQTSACHGCWCHCELFERCRSSGSFV